MMGASSGVKNDQYKGEELENTDDSDEEEAPLRMVIQEIEKSRILLLTPIWEEVLYKTSCDLGTQYYYIMYDKNTEPKCYAREIRLDLYQDQECEKRPNIYTHQINNDKYI